MYDKVSTKLNFVENEDKVLKFWNENKIFEKSIDEKKDLPTYTFYDGPPTANGKPHIGHVLTRVIKDMIPRYQTMKGHKIIRKAGWDTHGLPVELEVEKEIGIDGKEQIEEYGIEPFIAKCKESVWKYKGMWEQFSGKVGFWADMDDPYVTYHNEYIESEWWALKKIWDMGLLYKGFKVVPYCPRCGTPLSSHEVAQGYKAVKERSAVVRFKAKVAEGEEQYYFLAWTTTPWTLPSNLALCVNPEESYSKVKACDGYTYIMADALLDTVLGPLAEEKVKNDEGEMVLKYSTEETEGKAYIKLESYKGIELEGREYEPLYEAAGAGAAKQHKKAHFIVADDYVTMSDGTGIVHIAPAFGEDDGRVGRKYDLPFVQFVDAAGNMTEETPFAGLFVKDADPKVLVDLDSRNLLFSAPKFEHDYPFCWRCDTPLIYYARESWFIKMTEVSDRMVANNDTVNWIPEGIGKGRFGEWLKNVQDWGLSRDRYWGTPLNVWECPDCGKRDAIGSIAELRERGKMDDGSEVPETIELHRPFIDGVAIACPDCGKPMHRVPEVIDCWFDSGAMPFAQWHYPFENEDIFNDNFPADFISEAVDQTRGWFYSLMAISTLLFDKAPYKNVIVLGHVQDKDGQKMSKSKGNAVDPMEALESFGADAIRWYFYTNSQPWLPNRFHEDAVKEGQRKFMGTLWNTYAFYTLYAEIDQFNPLDYELDTESLSIMDKWLLSKLNTAIKTFDENLGNYRIPEAAAVLSEFVDDLSNWYVRRGRERYWVKGMPQDKINAYMTLYTALVTICEVAAPMVPFITESIYQNLVRNIDKDAPESIHLCEFPEVNEELIDAELEEKMEEILKIKTYGSAARNTANIKNRQPIANMYIKAAKTLDGEFLDIVRDELNIKNVEFKDDVSEFSTYIFKPQLRTVGPKYGKLLGGIKEYLASVNGTEAMNSLKSEGALKFEVNGEEVSLAEEDLLIEVAQSEDFVTEGDNSVTVVIDTKLTPELIEEGFVREIISKVQTMRKEADFEVMDRIILYMANNDRLAKIVARNDDKIKNAVLAEHIVIGSMAGFTKEWDINGEEVTLGVAK
jgi:isoleucyl-tRNA synthetase